MNAPRSNGPFFIVGAQRSGTTLLRLLLNAHSRIAVPEEARFLSPLLKRRNIHRGIRGKELQRLIRYLRANEQFQLWNYDSFSFFSALGAMDEVRVPELIHLLYTSYRLAEGKEIWGDKSLFFHKIGVLRRMFPSAKFLHIVRDGRDVFASWRTMDATKGNPAMVAADWSCKLFLIEQAFRSLPEQHRMTIRYEDLVRDTQGGMERVCAFLGVNYEADMLEFYRNSPRYIGRHHSNLIFQAVNPSNTAKWRSKLRQKEVEMFNTLAGSYLKRYGYETASVPFRPEPVFDLVHHLCRGVARRAQEVVSTRWIYRNALRQGRATEGIEVGVRPEESSRPQGT